MNITIFQDAAVAPTSALNLWTDNNPHFGSSPTFTKINGATGSFSQILETYKVTASTVSGDAWVRLCSFSLLFFHVDLFHS